MSKFDMSLMKQIGDRLQKAEISLKSTSVRYLSTPSAVMRFIYQIVSGSLVAGATVSHLLMAIALPLLTLPNVANAQGIVTDPTAPLRFQPQLGTAGNGVPIVNITAPNSSGLSHNKYQDFNVGKDGVILNNSVSGGVSQLGGQINGNSLLGGRAATRILNEVTGSNASNLLGALEVFGQQADVIIANPNGVFCNGCSFTNIGALDLTTGIPEISAAGDLLYKIGEGEIHIGKDGLSAESLSALRLLGRKILAEGSVAGPTEGNLRLQAGAQTFNADTGTGTVNSGAAPAGGSLAIDASALGAFSAGSIDIIATDAGMGVKMPSMLTAIDGDVQLDAAGNVILGGIQADAGKVTLNSGGELTQTGRVVADQALTVTADRLTVKNTGSFESKDKLTITTQTDLENHGSLSANKDIKLSASGDVDNQGRIVTPEDLEITAQNLNNQNRGVEGTGYIESRKLALLVVDRITNDHATMRGLREVRLKAQQLENKNSAYIISDKGAVIDVSGDVTNQDGVIQTVEDLSVTVGGDLNSKGAITSEKTAQVSVAGDASVTGFVTGKTGLSLDVDGDLTVENAEVTSEADATVTTDGTFYARGGVLNGASLDLTIAGALDVDDAVTEIGKGANLTVSNYRAGETGVLQVMGDLGLTIGAGGSFLNEGGLIVQGDFDLTSPGDVINRHTLAVAGSSNITTDGDFRNESGRLVYHDTSLESWKPTVKKTYFYASQGDMLVLGDLNVTAQGGFYNKSSTIDVGGNSNVTADSLINDHGTYFDRNISGFAPHPNYPYHTYTGRGRWFNNEQAQFSTGGNLNLTITNQVHNDSSVLSAGGDMVVKADSLTNLSRRISFTGGELLHSRTGKIHTITDRYGSYSKTNGALSAPGQVTLDVAGPVTNSATIASNSVHLTSGKLINGLQGNFYQTPATTIPDAVIDLTQYAPLSSDLFKQGDGDLYQIESILNGGADYDQFVDPTYLFDKLAQTRNLRFYADPVLETKLVRDAALRQTGQNYFDHDSTSVDGDQRKSLYDNAADFAEKIKSAGGSGPVLGERLTMAQREALEAPILWYVSKQVNGEEVLVPEVILPEVARRDLAFVKTGAIRAKEADLQIAGDVVNSGDIRVQEKLKLRAASLRNEKRTYSYKIVGHHSGGRHERSGTVAQGGANILAGTVDIKVDGDLRNKGGVIAADEDATLIAGGNISNEAVKESYFSSSTTKKRGFLSSKKTSETIWGTNHVGGVITAGRDVTVQSDQAITVKGSEISAGQNVSVTAKEDVTVSEVVNEHHERFKSKKSGLFANFSAGEGGLSATVGWKSEKKTRSLDQEVAIGSGIYAGNDVDITSEGKASLTASQLQAGNDVTITAKDGIDLKAGQNRTDRSQTYKSTTIGVTAGISQSITGSIRNAIDAPQQLVKSVKNAKGGAQYQALSAAGGAFRTIEAIKGLSDTAGGLGGLLSGEGGSSGVSLHASIGIDSQKSSSSSSETEAVVSSISSGNDITLTTDKDLTLEGAQVTAQNDVTITADNVIATAAQNSYDSQNSSSSKGMSLGVSYDPFTGGMGVKGNISASKSKGKSEGVTHQNALIASGNKVSITTTEDLTLKGANISGTEVDLDVGKDLTIASVQDTGSSSNSSIGGSFGLSQNYGAGGDVTSQGVSASINGSKGSSEKEWVSQQSSIIAKEKLDIRVEDHTQVDGAVIASKSDDLKLDTGTLGFSDLQDKDQSSQVGGGISVSYTVSTGTSDAKDDKDDGTKPDPKTGDGKSDDSPNKGKEYANLEINYAAHDKRQITRATIGKGDIIVRDNPSMDLSKLNRDLNKAQEITKDEQIAFDFYVSSTAIEEIASGFAGTREGFAQFAKGLSELGSAIDDLAKYGTIDETQIALLRKIASCGGETAAWSPWDLLISKAYAESDCSDVTMEELTLAVEEKTLRALIDVCKDPITKAKAQLLLAKKIYRQLEIAFSDGDKVAFEDIKALKLSGYYSDYDYLDELSPKGLEYFSLLVEVGNCKIMPECHSILSSGMGMNDLDLFIDAMKYDAEVPEESGLGFDTRGYSPKEYEKLALLEGVGADLVFVGAGHAVSLTARELFKNTKFVSQAIAKIGAKDFYALRDKVLDKSADVVLTIKNDKISISEVGKKILHSANKLFEATSKLFQIFKKNRNSADDVVKNTSNKVVNNVPDVPVEVPYFRVEGGGSGTAVSQHRITSNADGSITINSGCSGQLCVSVGNKDHATYFLTQKRPNGTVVVFDIDRATHNRIMEAAIPQRPIPGVPRDPNAPKIVDPNQPGTAIELPKMWNSILEDGASNSRTLTSEQFLKDFKDLQ